MIRKLFSCLALVTAGLWAAENYTGPRPPKPDIPYLKQAGNLIPTEVSTAQQGGRKGDTYTIEGANSTARTPLAEPIFILDSSQLSPDRIELYRLEVRKGNREVNISGNSRRGGAEPLHLQVTPLGGHLYRIEADQHLDDGEYALSSSDSNRVFCFEVY